MSRAIIGLIFIVAVGFIGLSSIYIVDEREKALVLQFGEVKVVNETPGIAWKLPFIQEAVRYDDRILPLDTQPLEVTMRDNRRFDVDAFARWRIVDVVQFRRATGTGGARAARGRLETILNAEMRQVLGDVNSSALLSSDRVDLMNQIRDLARAKASAFGVEIVDVRIKRADLPIQNLEKTFERMRAEREREAADEIARGNEAAQRVRAGADREVVEKVSEANKTAEIIRGKADATRIAIYASAFSQDKEFFAFYRSLSAYRKALKGDNSTIVLSPDSEFFQYLKSAEPF